jgi:hypothetical protein
MQATHDTIRQSAQATLTDIAASLDRLAQANPSSDHPVSPDAKVRLGREAMARQRRSFEDWLAIGEAIEVGQTESMHRAGINRPTGKRFNKIMGEWLVENGFAEIGKSTRSRLLECLRHRDAIMMWRSHLTDGERFNLNHPEKVLRKWNAKTHVPDPNAEPKQSPIAKARESIAKLEEENHRLRRKIERGEAGDRWKPTDRATDIARVIVDTFATGKALDIAKYIKEHVKQKEVSK